MMTKSTYREYISSDKWQQFRKLIIDDNRFCERCGVPRYLSALVYDQDLHVHHKHYRNIGRETKSDLEVLCRRCHEIETFGHSQFKEIPSFKCSSEGCEQRVFDRYAAPLCPDCIVEESYEAGRREQREWEAKCLS